MEVSIHHCTGDAAQTLVDNVSCSRLLCIKRSGDASDEAGCRGVCEAQDSLQLHLPWT